MSSSWRDGLELALAGVLLVGASAVGEALGQPWAVSAAFGVCGASLFLPWRSARRPWLAWGIAYGAAFALMALAASPTVAPTTAIATLCSAAVGVALCVRIGSTLPDWRGRVWLALMLGIGLSVSFLSGPQGGAGRFLAFLQEGLGLSLDTALAVNFVVRKTVHLTLYGLLALAASRARSSAGGSRGVAVTAGFCWALPHAVYDEWHQGLSPGRTGSLVDVGIDALGMALFLSPQILSLRKRGEE